MNDFIYDIPVTVYFGNRSVKKFNNRIKKIWKNVLMTYGGGSIKKSGLYDKVINEIKKAGLNLFELSGIEPNPIELISARKGAAYVKMNRVPMM